MDSNNEVNNKKFSTVEDQIKKDDVRFVIFEQTDMYGVARSKTVPVKHFNEKVTSGLPFYLGHIGFDPQANIPAGTGYNEETGYADSITFADPDTYVTLPWMENTGRILIEPTYKGEFVAAHPRVIARKQLDHLKEMGFSLLAAHEYEMYIVDQDTLDAYTKGKNIHSTIRNYKDPKLVNQFLTDLPKVGVDIEVFESEYAPGQVEMSYKPSFGIKSGDTAHTFKTSVKEIALQNKYIASFMTKPFPDKSGSSCHFNHSLWDVNGEKGMMHAENTTHGLSEEAEHWIAGLLVHAQALAILMAPTVNCLSRYKPHTFAPCNVTWGIDNRTTAMRVKVNGERGTYIENRLGSAGANPYLVLAGTIAAGIDGIQRKLQLPPPVTGNAYDPNDTPPETAMIPNGMKQALEYFENDKILREALGKEFCQCFGALKLHEIQMQENAEIKGDTDWERDLFFEYL